MNDTNIRVRSKWATPAIVDLDTEMEGVAAFGGYVMPEGTTPVPTS